ncbi:unnamed protein product [Calypogeia fissa]
MAQTKKKGGGKKDKKGIPGDEDDFDVVETTEVDATPSEESSPAGKKKGGKKGKKGAQVDDEEFKVSEPMNSKEASAEELVDDDYSFGGKKKGGKKGKKGALVDDEEFEALASINAKEAPAEESVEDDYSFGGKKKGGKKGKKRAQVDDEEFEVSATINAKDTLAEEPVHEDNAFGGKKKGGKKGKKKAQVDDEEFEVLTTVNAKELTEESVEDEYSVAGQKKGGKKGKKEAQVDDIEFEVLATISAKEVPAEESVEDDYSFGGKKKGGKKGKKGAQVDDEEFDGFSTVTAKEALAEESVEDDYLFGGKKKGAKQEKKVSQVDDEEFEDAETITAKEEAPAEGDDRDEYSFGGLKKEGKKGGFNLLEEIHPEEDTEEIVFSGKKKPKKSKKDGKKDLDVEDTGIQSPVVADEPQAPADASSVVTESSNISVAGGSSKRKGKKGSKSGRTAQEEEDLDALLAALEAPKVSKPASKMSASDIPAVDTQPPEALAEAKEEVQSTSTVTHLSTAEPDEAVESAAAKKKKKKKEKEKEKKAAAVEKPSDEVAATDQAEALKGKAVEKKVPKHLKAMQEQLLKIKEAEEKRKREEEEKRLKEEEEQARLEELERQKEEAKKRRKEREKEKLLQKKKEGKLLTGKQKEEARRLALMREQMLAQAGLSPDSEGGTPEDAEAGAPRKTKPKYETKSKRRKPGSQQVAEQPGDVGPADGIDMNVEESNIKEEEEPVVESIEPMEAEAHVEDAIMVEQPLQEMAPEPEEEEDEEDWDAKSFEDVALPAIKSAFAEDEVEDVREVVVVPAAGKVTKRVVSSAPVASTPAKRPVSPVKRPPASATKRPQQKGPANRKVAAPVAEESEDDEETESDEEESEEEDDAETRKKRLAKEKREARKADALMKRSADDLRSPICCILGHVDTGKTKLLDCIRRTNVQEGEAGGITQQIGATYFPMENIRERTKDLKATAEMRVPGLLVIDTPGHESFTNLRARGSSLCDIAILVIDIMHGLEPQTIESLKLLQMRKTPFVVALNKVDRLYDWRSTPNSPIQKSLRLQGKQVVQEFETRTNAVITQLKEQGMNSELYYKNKEVRKVISMVPTSAVSGEGVPDLLMLLVQLTQRMMEEKLMYVSEVQCTVLEVKMIEGLGTTIDVVLVNGVLHEGDQIVVCGMQGPIVTTIRALLTPHPMKELRVKGSYEKHKELKAAQGIKITAQGLEHAIAGTQLYVVGPDDDVDDIKQEAMEDMKNVMSRVDKSGEGVCVQASTLGSLEALLEFLKSPAVKIPVSGINIGPVHKKDVMRASVMLERKRKEFATILAFDVKVTQEAKELADELGVKIFTADIIYHLFDQFTNYISTIKEEKRKESAEEAVFPCVLKIVPECVFNKKDPIIVGVNVLEGIAKVGTPLCVPSREFIEIGKIASIEVNHKVVDTAKKGQAVAMKIIGTNAEETQKMFGRHFDLEDELVSSITRRSIDLLKENYRDDLAMEDWKLVVKLKVLFQIP